MEYLAVLLIETVATILNPALLAVALIASLTLYSGLAARAIEIFEARPRR